MSGTASEFDLRYSTAPITASNFAQATRWQSMPAPSAPGSIQSVTVTGLEPNTTYWFAIKTGDDVPNWSSISNVISKTTAPAADTQRPAPLAITVTGATDSTATLAWTAVGDDSLTGTAASYDVRYSTAPITAANWSTATQVSGEPTPKASGAAESFTVPGLGRQVTYYFAVRVADEAGNASALSNVPSATTPDTMAPESITDLSASLIWLGWGMAATRPESIEVPRP